MKITSQAYYRLNNGRNYEVVSDFVNNLPKVPLENVVPPCPVEIEDSDCYIDGYGNLYTPTSYRWIQKDWGSDDYKPMYDERPTLSAEDIANLIK